MSYADYDFYINNYGGNLIPSENFDFWARKSTQYIRTNTFGNIDETQSIIESVKMCCCEIADQLYSQDKRKNRQGITSEKVGEHSISYESAEAINKAEKEILKQILIVWLANTGLLYRGLC